MVVWYAIISVFLVSAISLIGVFGFSLKQSSFEKIVVWLISFATGAMFGDVFFHLLPEVVDESNGFGLSISLSILFGILVSFTLEKLVHWRHLHNPRSHDNHIQHSAVMNLWGETIHNFIDGLIIGGSYLVSIPTGLASTLAVIFHEVPQELGDYGVLVHGGFSRTRALLVNFLSATTAFIGLGLALRLHGSDFTMYVIPFAAGNFIYIAGADLIPLLHKEVGIGKSIVQLAGVISGMIVMYGLLFVEVIK